MTYLRMYHIVVVRCDRKRKTQQRPHLQVKWFVVIKLITTKIANYYGFFVAKSCFLAASTVNQVRKIHIYVLLMNLDMVYLGTYYTDISLLRLVYY